MDGADGGPRRARQPPPALAFVSRETFAGHAGGPAPSGALPALREPGRKPTSARPAGLGTPSCGQAPGRAPRAHCALETIGTARLRLSWRRVRRPPSVPSDVGTPGRPPRASGGGNSQCHGRLPLPATLPRGIPPCRSPHDVDGSGVRQRRARARADGRDDREAQVQLRVRIPAPRRPAVLLRTSWETPDVFHVKHPGRIPGERSCPAVCSGCPS